MAPTNPAPERTGGEPQAAPGPRLRRLRRWPSHRVALAAVALSAFLTSALLTWRLAPPGGLPAVQGRPGGWWPGTEKGAPHPGDIEDGSVEAGAGHRSPTPEQQAAPPAPTCTQVTIKAVGDLLIHLPLVQAAETGGGHDFRPIFEPVAHLLAAADLTIANLETTLGGPERGWSGYPRFNTPDSLLDAVREAGVDVLTTANNHTLDTGAAGLTRTLEVIRSAGLEAAGTRASPEEPGFALVEAGGLKIAVLAYTYGTNGIPVPEPHMVNLLDRDRMAADVAAARAAGADLVVAAPHWGLEYQRLPSDEQRDLARYLASLGVDVIFGAHPHVVQPVEILEPAVPGGRPVPVFYSMGNFVSNQRDRYTDWGIIAEVTFTVERRAGDDSPRIFLSRVSHQPVWVHRFRDPDSGRRGYRVLPVELPAAGGTDPAGALAEAGAGASPGGAWPGLSPGDPLLTDEDRRRLAAVAAEALELPGAAVVYASGLPAPATSGSDSLRNWSTSASAASMPSCQNSGPVRSTPR